MARTTDDLETAITQFAAMEQFMLRRRLRAIVAYDRSEAWQQDGATDMVAWLSYRLNVTLRTARDLHRVAHDLERLPRIADAFESGRLSWDQVRAVTEVADPSTDADWAERAQGCSARHLELVVRRTKCVREERDAAAHRQRILRMRWSPDGSVFWLSGRLPGDQGSVVERAIHRLTAAAPRDTETSTPEPEGAVQADALVQLASQYLAIDGNADRATVVLHADLPALRGGEGSLDIDGARPVSVATARLLACDARIQVNLYRPDGTVGVGRLQRIVPPWLVRQLRRRDGSCRFPGCARKRYVHAHHIVHWVDGGRTDDDNLALLCSYHHALMHRGWTMSGHPDGRLRFGAPNGRQLEATAPLRSDLRGRLLSGDRPTRPVRSPGPRCAVAPRGP